MGWLQVGLVMKQLDGLTDGYNKYAPKDQVRHHDKDYDHHHHHQHLHVSLTVTVLTHLFSCQQLNSLDMLLLQLQAGDLGDIENAVGATLRTGTARHRSLVSDNDVPFVGMHCSSLVKVR